MNESKQILPQAFIDHWPLFTAIIFVPLGIAAYFTLLKKIATRLIIKKINRKSGNVRSVTWMPREIGDRRMGTFFTVKYADINGHEHHAICRVSLAVGIKFEQDNITFRNPRA